MNTVINLLNSITNNAATIQNPSLFFPLLNQFAKTILTEPIIKEPIQEIYTAGQKAMEPLNLLKRNAINELSKRAESIEIYITQSSSNSNAAEYLKLFHIQGENIGNSNKLRKLLTPLELCIDYLLNDPAADHAEFIATFANIHHINDDTYIRTKEAFPDFTAWENEVGYFYQERQTEAWYSLNQLMVFFERYNWRHYDKVVDSLTIKGIDTNAFQEEHSKFMQYAYREHETVCALFPSVEEYKHHMRQLLVYVTQYSATIYTTSYDHEKRKLTINNMETEFKKISGSAVVIGMLFSKTGEPKKKSFESEAAREKLIAIDHAKEEPDIYEICRSINKNVAGIGFNDFILFSADTFQINPKYL